MITGFCTPNILIIDFLMFKYILSTNFNVLSCAMMIMKLIYFFSGEHRGCKRKYMAFAIYECKLEYVGTKIECLLIFLDCNSHFWEILKLHASILELENAGLPT